MGMAPVAPSLEELFLLVSDLERSARFYRDGLQLRTEYEGGNFLVLRGEGGSRILIHDAEGEAVQAGSFEMEFRVDDVDGWYDRLADRGAAVRREPFRVAHEGDPWSPRREARLADPDGYGIVLFTPLGSR